MIRITISSSRANLNPCFFLAWSLTLFAFADLAMAQESDSDLRRQNQQLAAQMQDVQKELNDARERNRALEARVFELEARLAEALKSAAAPVVPPSTVVTKTEEPPIVAEEPATIDETIPSASPRALYKALIARHDEFAAGLDLGGGETTDALRERAHRTYLKKLEGWRSAINREFRAPIKWHVRVIEARTEPENQHVVTLVAVDPQTDVQLGDTFDAAISPGLVERLARYEARGELGALVMRGTLIPDVRINPDREIRGSFDRPPFIGPFTEFMFRVDVTSLVQPREEPVEITPAPEKTPAPSPPPLQ